MRRHRDASRRGAYSNATPIRNSLRQAILQVSLNPSSGITNVNVAGIGSESDSRSAAPVTDRSRIVQAIFSQPNSILAGLATR